MLNRLGGNATILPFDLSSEEDRLEAQQALTTSRVNLALSTEAGFDLHVLSNAKVPVVVVARSPDMLWMAADVVASLRVRGVVAFVASSWEDAAVRVQRVLSPSILAGKKVLIFGQPFDSATLPSRNLTREYVLERTGVDVAFLPLESLQDSLAAVDESRAQEEMNRWMEGATEVRGASAESILDSCRLYVVLKNIVEAEGLSGLSIDCVRYTYTEKPLLPHPCLAFSRLRDEGIAAPCEADVCAMLTELLLEAIAQRPSFLGNIGAVDIAASTTDLLHCLVPLRMAGYDTEPLPYRLRDYHGLVRGVSMDVDFITDREVTLGAFSKDLCSFVLWPGTLIETGSGFCQSMARVHIPDPERFLHSIAGCHYIMVYGNFVSEVSRALMRMNVPTIGPIAAHDTSRRI
jgi:L-fucose isomerase-like protein